MKNYLSDFNKTAIVSNYITSSPQLANDSKTCNILDYYVSTVSRPISFGMSVDYIIGYSHECFAIKQSMVISFSKDNFKSSRNLNSIEQDALYLTLIRSLSSIPKRKNRL